MDRVEATVRALVEIGFTEIYVSKEDVKIPTEKEVQESVQEPKVDKRALLMELYRKMEEEKKCPIYEGSSGYVFGEGNPYSEIVFVGEAPGEEEDKQKRPFVGKAGQYLTEKLMQFNIKREDVYITNVVKSRPPGNRKPTKEEISKCVGYLKKEIEIINPKVIVCLGATAYEGITGKEASVTKIRGSVFSYPFNPKIKVVVTYHPAYVLRNPKADAEFTKDIETVVNLIKLQK